MVNQSGGHGIPAHAGGAGSSGLAGVCQPHAGPAAVIRVRLRLWRAFLCSAPLPGLPVMPVCMYYMYHTYIHTIHTREAEYVCELSNP